MRREATAGLVVLALCVVGCASTSPGGAGLGPEGDYLRGEQLFEEGRNFQAVEVLERFRSEHPGSDRVDDAIFLLGRAHQRMGEQILARDEFERLLRDYPQSDHREEAQYQIAATWIEESRGPALDPEPSERALEALDTYLRFYPEGSYTQDAERLILELRDRLAVKAYLNARTYMRLDKPEAAVIYFEKSLWILEDSSKAGDALLGMAKAYRKMGRMERARETYRRLLDYATPERIEADGRLRSLRQDAEDALAEMQTERRF